ncbi:serine hydrolase [Olivibacter sp. SDN3]|uniref:serine hydrolase domain-containing protein n=1 Tax=Olivibacter sp. SDN3 TaxID=2764720 RepID=UPI0016517668|nr:serine hydrolase [Olivibacter sp. SDN3]QNL47819.1 serine hydrolase [Olivibacter sp. SDN3]
MRIIIFLVLVVTTETGRSQIFFDTSSHINNNRAIFSLVVSVKDSIAYAGSFNGKENNDLFNNQSLTKNVEAVLIGIAIDKGFIRSLDTKIADFLPELKDETDKRKLNITLGDLMNQSSGLWHENLERLDIYLGLNNPSGHVLKQSLLSEPGTELYYNNAASHLLSVILSKATGQTTFDFARKYLFEPLGIQRVEWAKMKDGYYDGSGLLSVRMSTIDMNKIGRLLLNGGHYRGKPIVSQKWVEALLKPTKTFPAPWGLPNTEYGLCFYHKRYKDKKLTYGMGWGGQFLILIPDLDAVISVNQEINDQTAIQQSETFMDRIFPMIFDWINAGNQKSSDKSYKNTEQYCLKTTSLIQ